VIRAVLDTNVLASGFVSFVDTDRAPSRVLHLWLKRRFELVISADIQTELRHTLDIPYFRRRLSTEQVEVAQRLLVRQATLVFPTEPVVGVATHPEDDQVLAAAVSANVDYLVTGDRQLLALGNYRGVHIVSPRRFLTLLEQDEPRQ
jgi:putative PIN family toxin of toxin-antitoxin system